MRFPLSVLAAVSAGLALGCQDRPLEPQSDPGAEAVSFKVKGTPSITITDLGTLGGDYSQAIGINVRGQVVGSSNTASGEYHAFVWKNGVMTDLGTMGGRAAGASAINARGQIVGTRYINETDSRPYMWHRGVVTHLDVVPGDHEGTTTAINVHGQIVGNSRSGSLDATEYHPLLWYRGDMTALPTLVPGWFRTHPFGINDRGQIVGRSRVSQIGAHAFLLEDGVITELVGPFGPDRDYEAHDINRHGQIVGNSANADYDARAILWDEGAATVLDLPPGYDRAWARAINDWGQIVGSSSFGPLSSDEIHAVLWQDGVPIDLVGLGGHPTKALDINNRGQIVGWGMNSDGERRAILWEIK